MPDPIIIDPIFAKYIPSFRPITVNSKTIGFRGRTLSAKKRRWLLEKMKKNGIDTIIDIRAEDQSDDFPSACQKAELKYFHFPIDKSRTPDKDIIEKLSTFIETINNGRFYISCALGLHRTDIALSIYYIFNPNTQEPPVLYGHIVDGNLKYDDIFQRVGSIYRSLKKMGKNPLGWDDSFEQEYNKRKKSLLEYQKKYLENFNL